MAVGIITNQSVYLDGYDLTGRSNSLALDYSADVLDSTTLGNDTRVRMGGLKMATVGVEGFMELDATDAALFNNIGVSNIPMSFGIAGDAVGADAYMMLTTQGNITLNHQVGQLYAFSLGAESTGKLIRGNVLLNSKGTPLTATADGAAVELGAIASGKTMYGALHVLEVGSGTPTLDAVIESDASDDFTGSETSRITFDQVTEIGSQWKTLAGPVTDTWWRPTITIGGGSPSFKAVLVVGII